MVPEGEVDKPRTPRAWFRSALRFYWESNAHFARRIFGSAPLLAFAALALAGQIGFGFHSAGLWGGVLLPLGNVAFMSVGLTVVRRLGRPVPAPSRAAPAWQLGAVLLVVGVFIGGLVHQYPDPAVANNPVTRAVLALTGPIGRSVEAALGRTGLSAGGVGSAGAAAQNIAVCMLLPLVLLLPVSRRASDYGLRKPALGLLASIVALYLLPLAFSPRTSVAAAVAYLFVAALPEEFLFRVLLQQRLRAFVRDPLVAICGAGLIFGLMHVPVMARTWGSVWGLLFAVGVNAFGGAWLGYIYQRSGSLWLVVAVHWLAGVAFGAAG